MSSQSEIQARSRRYAALRNAQRALGAGLHPTELQRALDQGRSIRGRLRALSSRAEASDPDEAGLRQVDRLLDRLSADTLGMLHRLGLEDGRHLFRRLAQEDPPVVQVVVSLTLESDLESDPNLRLLEYLVTLLCSGRNANEKVVTRAPFEAVPALEAVYTGLRETLDPSASNALSAFESATAELAECDDVGETRDRMRRYKRELGSRMLHPHVFAALVAYNVAIANRVESLIEEGGLQHELKQDLQELTGNVDPSDSLFDSDGFARLVVALTRRVRGETCDDAPAKRLAAACDPEGLSPGEVEAFEAPEEESNARLARAAVALGLVLAQPEGSAPALAELGIDTERVAGSWPWELWRAMTAAAQNLLADGRFAEAQRLAAVRGRHLHEHRAGFRAAGVTRAQLQRKSGDRADEQVPSPSESPFFRRTALGLALLVCLLMFAASEWPARRPAGLDPALVASLSPYLAAAERQSPEGLPQLVGTLLPGWRKLGDTQRREAVEALGSRVAAMGIARVLLVDEHQLVQGRYENGEAVWVAPAPGG